MWQNRVLLNLEKRYENSHGALHPALHSLPSLVRIELLEGAHEEALDEASIEAQLEDIDVRISELRLAAKRLKLHET